MPLFLYSDDIVYQGTPEDLNRLTYYATFYAGILRGIELNLIGNPPYFFPSNPTGEILGQFLYDFTIIFGELVNYLENGTFV